MNIKSYLLYVEENPLYLKYLKATSKLPDEYQELDYIESNGTQYIDTGYVPNENTVIKADYKSNKAVMQSFHTLFGMQNSANEGRLYVLFGTQNNYQINLPRNDSTFAGLNADGTTTSKGIAGNYFTNDRVNYILDVKNKEVKIGNKSWDLSTMSGDYVAPTYNLYLLARNNGGVADTDRANGLLYGTKIYDNNKLVRDLVPAVKKSNGNQLFDYTRTDGIIANKYINQAGAIVSGANDYYISYPISVTPGETYTWRFNADSISTTHTAPTVGFYDTNNNLISTAQHATAIKYFSFTVPSNCAYIRCSVYTVNDAQQQAMLNKGARPLRYETYIPDEVGMYDLSATSRNLANLHNINKTALSLNFKTGDNMTIVVNGTKASGANVIAIANPNIMLPAGTYTVKIKMIDGTISNITGGAIFGINASTYAMRTTPAVNKVGDIGTRKFTLTEDTLLTSLDITPSYGDVGSVWNNATFECWLYSGSDDVPYEPYQKRFYTNDGTGEFIKGNNK